MTRTVRSESISALIVQTGREMEQLKASNAALLAALKVMVDPDLGVNDLRAAKQMARAAIVQAETAGFKVPS